MNPNIRTRFPSSKLIFTFFLSYFRHFPFGCGDVVDLSEYQVFSCSPWQAETLFKVFKSRGFNIENTHVTDQKRLEKLFMVVMIALVWCYKIGDHIHENIKEIKLKNTKGNRLAFLNTD